MCVRVLGRGGNGYARSKHKTFKGTNGPQGGAPTPHMTCHTKTCPTYNWSPRPLMAATTGPPLDYLVQEGTRGRVYIGLGLQARARG